MSEVAAAGTELDKEVPMSAAARGWRRVVCAVGAGAEALASRPRGHQLLRQIDSVLELSERLSRQLARALALAAPFRIVRIEDVVDTWGQPPHMPLTKAIPLLILVLPLYMAVVFVILVPFLPVLLPVMIFGPLADAVTNGKTEEIGHWIPTPANITDWLRRWRRRLRGVRFNGLRKMRTAGTSLELVPDSQQHNGEPVHEDSLILRILVWWPVTIMAVIGQIFGLGEQITPIHLTPSPVKKVVESPNPDIVDSNGEQMSPRKRKMPDSEQEFVQAASASDTDTTTATESEWEDDEEPITVEDASRVANGSILAALLSDKPLPSDEEDDPDYVPSRSEESEDDITDDNLEEGVIKEESQTVQALKKEEDGDKTLTPVSMGI